MGEDWHAGVDDRGRRASPPGSLRGATAVRTLPGTFVGGSVAISPDGRLGLCGGDNEPVRLWDLATGTLLRTLGSRGAGAAGVATDGRSVWASGDGTFMRGTATGWMRRFHTFDPRGLRPVDRRIHHDQSARVRGGQGAVAFSASGGFALGICADHALRLWDLSDGTCTRTLIGHTPYPDAVWLDADGRRAVSAGSDAEIRVWDVDSGECAVFPHPGSCISSVCLSPDGRLVLAAGDRRGIPLPSRNPGLRRFRGRGLSGRTLWLVDASTGDLVRTFEDVRRRGLRRPRHPGDRSVEALTARFTSDGRFAVSGGDDGRIRVWNTTSGRCVRTLDGHTDDVYGIALTPDDRFLLSGGSDGTLRLWELDW
ncbi:WD40 repeat domain-containing protein [Streptomyces mobaraensis]|uniref:WD40 repeat domain-containing protein n=1 Tax=Streptomyces mobaraensis TaxID=35621 RepID=UPI00331FB51F